MDFGERSGNQVKLENCTDTPWTTEYEVLQSLCHDEQLRAAVLQAAEAARFSQWADVFLVHDLLFVPLLLPPNITDGKFLNILSQRAYAVLLR